MEIVKNHILTQEVIILKKKYKIVADLSLFTVV